MFFSLLNFRLARLGIALGSLLIVSSLSQVLAGDIMSLARAKQILNDGKDDSIDHNQALQAASVLFNHLDDPEVAKILVHCVGWHQNPEVVEEIINRLDPSVVPESKETVNHLLSLLNFAGYGIVPGVGLVKNIHSGVSFSNGEDVRGFAALVLGKIKYTQAALKNQAQTALVKFIDGALDDASIGFALQSLYELGDRSEAMVKRLLFAVQDELHPQAMADSLAILSDWRLAQRRRDVRLVVMRSISQNEFSNRARNTEGEEGSVRSVLIAYHVLSNGLEALGFEPSILMQYKVGRVARPDPIPQGIFPSLLTVLIDRTVDPRQAEVVWQIRRKIMKDSGRAYDLGDHENLNRVDIAEVAGALRRAGYKDFNADTGIAELRMVMESGLLGYYSPPQDVCKKVLSDLGYTHHWDYNSKS